MTMEVKILSRECIKPSAPLPNHPKTHKISLLDQFSPTYYFPIVLYYPLNQDTLNLDDVISNRSQVLKQSLSDTINLYYPLAGKIEDDLSADCNDEGVCYIVAEINWSLSDYLSQPDLNQSPKFLPDAITFKVATSGDHVAMIQESRFSCGGIAIGMVFSHTVFDGVSMSEFVKSWAAMASKSSGQKVLHPNFDTPSHFPPVDSFPEEATFSAIFSQFSRSGKCVLRRFGFDASAIARLKTKATSSGVQNPTRVEVVTALLWKSTISALEAKAGIRRPHLVTHGVNMRRRAVPEFPESLVGNCIWVSAAVLSTSDDLGLSSLLGKVREAISKINGDYVKSIRGSEDLFKLDKVIKEITGAAPGGLLEYTSFDSWCNFGLYKVDFGWGIPWWISCVPALDSSSTSFTNRIFLMDSRPINGDYGVEAWVYMDHEEMAMLENDKELRAFASMDSSPIESCKLNCDSDPSR